ncbi:MAG TPA: cation:proton antiporter [Candidatus Limnocylindrales bacterium]|nr:cation:proton antiporter [Candidatus Limnocylindrales bacterium]
MAHDVVAPLLLALAVVLAAASAGGWLAERIRQPSVLGELIAGILLGNVGLLGFHGFEWFAANPELKALAEIGVIVLLFDVGLESTVGDMLKVGRSALLVAVLGVIAPFALGWAAGAWLLPGRPAYVHMFLGAVLTATSVGITARVLRDLGRTKSPEARIILGAAVIDDVLGLVILAVVSGIIAAAARGGEIPFLDVAWIAGKALGFLALAIVLGSLIARHALRWIAGAGMPGALLTGGLVVCFVLSYLAAAAGLAPIVGAFAAGLILEPAFFAAFEETRRGETIRSSIRPISTILVPVFFVRTGLLVDLRSFADPRILGIAAALTLAACLGKQACILGVLDRGVNRLAIGIGMIPRGEVGLIFANIGVGLTLAGERIVTPPLYAAVVLMVIATTLMTPPALQWSFRRGGRARD